MDALEMLISQHRVVAGLFDELKSTTSDNKRKIIFQTIKGQLENHTYLEEQFVYPLYARYPELSEQVRKSLQEHHEVTEVLRKIQSLASSRSEAHDELTRLFDLLELKVRQHVEEEEQVFFPEIRKLSKRPEREQLGRHMQAAEQERGEAA